MKEAEILEAIAHAIRAEAERTREMTIEPETRLVEELGLDSIDLVGVTMRLEDRFHVEINVQEIKNFRCVSDLMDQLTGYLGKSAA